MKKIINEIIVVEGRDDISAVKAAVDAEVVAVHGFSVRRGQNLDKLETAYRNRGLIILTDPDYAGEQIRRAIMSRYPDSKNAYIARDEGTKGDDIGVENARPEAIIKALEAVKSETPAQKNEIFSMEDLVDNGLTGGSDAKEKREKLGKILSIGYSNSKQLLSKLNRYNISREDFDAAVKKI